MGPQSEQAISANLLASICYRGAPVDLHSMYCNAQGSYVASGFLEAPVNTNQTSRHDVNPLESRANSCNTLQFSLHSSIIQRTENAQILSQER
jgi:hypothetical protein